MERSVFALSGAAALIGAGTSLVVPSSSTLGFVLLAAGAMAMRVAYDFHLTEKQTEQQTEREGAERSYTRGFDALLDLLAAKWGKIDRVNPADGEDALMRLVGESSWPTKDVWDDLNAIDNTNLRGFLTGTIRRAHGEERALLTKYRQAMRETYEEWSNVLEEKKRQSDGFTSWLTRMRRLHENPFHLWAYMELAVTEARESLHGKDPNFEPVDALRQLWGRS